MIQLVRLTTEGMDIRTESGNTEEFAFLDTVTDELIRCGPDWRWESLDEFEVAASHVRLGKETVDRCRRVFEAGLGR